MPDESPVIADIQLIALDGERSYGTLPAVRDVAIRVTVNVLEPEDADESESARRPVTILATLFLEVFGVEEDADDGASVSSAARPPGSQAAGSREPVYSGRVTFRIEADRPAGEEPGWIPALFAQAWPYLRSQVISHSLLLGMGRIPVPLEAPENLARQPRST